LFIYAVFMSIPASTRRRYLSNFLAMLVIFAGMQSLLPASATNPVGSIQFSGNGNVRYAAGAPGSQNTTIEFWMKQTSTGGLQRIFTTSWSFNANNITIRTGGSTCLTAAVANNELGKPAGTDYSCPTLNVWHHIALVGLGTTWNLYVDGKLALTRSAWTLTNGWADPTKPSIGDSDAYIGGLLNENFNGYISNFRYVIGTAVYSSSFSPPNPPLSATQSAGSSGIAAISSGTTILLNTLFDSTLSTARVDSSGNARTSDVTGSPVASSETPVLAATSINSFTIPSLTYGTPATMSATSSVAGQISFLANSEVILGCSAVSTNGTNTATCTFTPTSTSLIPYTINFIPTSAGYSTLTGVNSTSVAAAKASLAVLPNSSSVSFGGIPSYSFTYLGFVNS
jgi:hypothetical protein